MSALGLANESKLKIARHNRTPGEAAYAKYSAQVNEDTQEDEIVFQCSQIGASAINKKNNVPANSNITSES